MGGARTHTDEFDQKLTPVRIGIWDSGVDTSLYPISCSSIPLPARIARTDWLST